MRRRYFLIDYENVQHTGLDGIKDLTKRDIVVIFYTNKRNTIPLYAIDNFAKATVKAFLIDGGDQSLDYQLGSYAGDIMAKLDITDCIYIVSKDHDYRKITHLWLQIKKKEKIFLCSSIKEGLEEYKTGLFGPYPWYIRQLMEKKKAISSMPHQQRMEVFTRLKKANIGQKHYIRAANDIVMLPARNRKERAKEYLISKYGKTEGYRLFKIVEDVLD